MAKITITIEDTTENGEPRVNVSLDSDPPFSMDDGEEDDDEDKYSAAQHAALIAMEALHEHFGGNDEVAAAVAHGTNEDGESVTVDLDLPKKAKG